MASWYPSHGPLQVNDGIKAQGQASKWWAKRWLALLDSFGWASRLARGRSYAKKGQVVDYQIDSGSITARVQGSERRPYDVKIGLQLLSDKVWTAAIAEMGQSAAFLASLLADHMPDNIEEAFPDRSPLLPQRASDFAMECSCPDFAVPCKHLAAVFYLLAELFDGDPFLIFALRGRTRQQILEQMPQLAGGAESEEEPEIPLDLEKFWDDPPPLPPLPPPSRLEASLLRRLGSPFSWSDEEEMLKAWLPLYRHLSKEKVP